MCSSSIVRMLPVLAIAITTGCATSPAPNLDRHFGEAVNEAVARQTLNPGAARNSDPVAGLDGGAAKAVVNRYQKSYEVPPAPVNVFTIGVGSGQGSGQP